VVIHIGSTPGGRQTGTSAQVEGEPAVEALQAVRIQVGRSATVAAPAVGSTAVEYLRAEPPPIQRVATGLMRRSWTWSLRGRARNIVSIGNTARSSRNRPYPILIERRYHVAQRTVDKHLPQIVAAAAADITDGIRQAWTTRAYARERLRGT